jgi:hypothetical protein
MKRKLILLSLLLFLGAFLITTSYLKKTEKNDVTVSVSDNQLLGDNFNLEAFTTLLKSTTDAGELEKQVNDPKLGINNLDLNNDASVDYVTVTTYGEGNTKGISLTVPINENETQEIAQVEINKTGEINIHGNETMYGQTAHYNTHLSTTDALFLMWMFSPSYHPYYSPYGYGRYPTYYSSYTPVSRTTYTQRTTTRVQNSGVTMNKTNSKPSLKSPNSSKTSKTVTKKNESLKKQTSTKKQFTKTDQNSKKKNTAFGNKTKSDSKSKSENTTSRSNNQNKSKSWSSKPSRSRGFSGGRSGGRRSDINSKENINYLTLKYGALERIEKLNPCTYFYTDEYVINEGLPKTMQYGLIAQEVEGVLPAMVMRDEQGLLLDYTQLSTVNTQAIKELMEKIEILELELENYKSLNVNQ